MRSIAWWHFQWHWRTPNPVFKVTVSLKSDILKTVHLRDKVSTEHNRKPHPVYRTVPLSMSSSNLWPGFQGHDIFEVEYLGKRLVLKTELLLHNTELRNIWNGTVFGELDWPLNASRRFVSIRWASCYYKTTLSQQHVYASTSWIKNRTPYSCPQLRQMLTDFQFYIINILSPSDSAVNV